MTSSKTDIQLGSWNPTWGYPNELFALFCHSRTGLRVEKRRCDAVKNSEQRNGRFYKKFGGAFWGNLGLVDLVYTYIFEDCKAMFICGCWHELLIESRVQAKIRLRLVLGTIGFSGACGSGSDILFSALYLPLRQTSFGGSLTFDIRQPWPSWRRG